MKVAFLIAFSLVTAFILVVAYANFFVQPAPIGQFIGAFCLILVAVLFYEVRPFRLMRK